MNLLRRSSVDQWFQSAKKGNCDTLEKIIDTKTAWNVDLRDESLRSALYVAAEMGQLEYAKKLLDHGADPNRQSKSGTPAHAAIQSKSADILVLLLNHGASLEAKNRKGQTVKELAKETFGKRRAEEILSGTENLRFDYLSLRKRKNTLMSAESCDELVVGYIKAPLPHIDHEDIEDIDTETCAKGPYSFYVKAQANDNYVTVKKYHSKVDEVHLTTLFTREVRAISNLRHPNILLLMSACYGPSLSSRCMVFEPVERGFLHRFLHVDGEPLQEDAIIDIARGVACALVYMHERGFLHCFIGTHSVTLTESFQPKICNFEYCQVLRPHDDSCGKPISHIPELYDFMAPEQLRGQPADKLGDVYSLGILVWECVTRKRPLLNMSFKSIMRKEDPRLKKIPGKWSANIKNLIRDCIKPANHRPNSTQVYDWLDGLANLRLVSPHPATMVIEDMPILFPKIKIELKKLYRHSI